MMKPTRSLMKPTRSLAMALGLLILAASAKAAPLLNLQDMSPAASLALSTQPFNSVSSFSQSLIPPATAGSSQTVTCVIDALQNTTAGSYTLTFMGDTTVGHYAWVYNVSYTGVVTNQVSNSAASIPLTNTGATLGIGKWVHFVLSFSRLPGMTQTPITTQTAFWDSGGNFEQGSTSGSYSQSGSVTSFTLTTSAGTMTGFSRCTYNAF